MKTFHLFLSISVIIVVVGFTTFKLSATKAQSAMDQSGVLYDIANYAPYTENNYQSAQKRGSVLLFFAATKWCQTCSHLDIEIQKNTKNIPSQITILKVDYDNNTSLNERYRVTSQHTLILLDPSGNEKKRWVGGDFTDLLKNIMEE